MNVSSNEWVYTWMNVSTNEWVYIWKIECVNGWMSCRNKWISVGQMKEYVNKWISLEKMNKSINKWKNYRNKMNLLVDEWMCQCIIECELLCEWKNYMSVNV